VRVMVRVMVRVRVINPNSTRTADRGVDHANIVRVIVGLE
jgi:hypothetical protein